MKSIRVAISFWLLFSLAAVGQDEGQPEKNGSTETKSQPQKSDDSKSKSNAEADGSDKLEIHESFKQQTAQDPKIELDALKIVLRPLTKPQLEKEVEAWLLLLQEKAMEVGTVELAIKGDGAEDESLKEKLVELRTDEAQLLERIRLVLEALKSKGGEVEEAETFIAAISSLKETTDSTSYWTAIWVHVVNWIKRDDGGILWIQRVVFAIILLLVFWLVSKIAGRMVGHLLTSRMNVSTLLENFARKTAGGVVMAVGLITAISALGVHVGPMLAALGAGGFIVGFALQETLGSFASGLMIMIYRPFDVDDYVSIADVSGTVKELSLVSTTLVTLDNKVVVIPNRNAWGQTIVNFTGKDLRRVDLVFGIGYEDDIRKAIAAIREVATGHDLVLSDPETTVAVQELADSSVNLYCRPWAKTEDYWTVRADLLRDVKHRLDAEGINIPYPQQDVHMHQS